MQNPISNPDILKVLIYIVATIVLALYQTYAKRHNHKLRLPVGFFIAYFLLLISITVFKYLDFPSILEGLELSATIILTLAIIRLVAFLFFDFLLERKRSTSVPAISRDLSLALLYLIAILVILRYKANVNLASLITTSAVLTAVIGLAMQDTLGNLIAGLVLQLEKPYQIGDWVSFDVYTGRVVGITWKSTKIMNRQKEMIYIPNSLISKSHILNYSQPIPTHIATVEIGASYKDPPNVVRRAILETLKEHPKTHQDPPPEVRVIKYNDFSIDYKILFYLSDFENEERIRSEVLNQIWYRFKRDGITIPFPIRTLHHIHPEPEKAARERKDLLLKSISILRSIEIFKPLSEDTLNTLAEGVAIDTFSPCEAVVKQGNTGDSMYIIVNGDCEVLLSSPGEKDHKLASLAAGQFFGEMSLLTGAPRTATVKALTDVCCLKIKKEDLEPIFKAHPEIIESISEVLFKREEELTSKKEAIRKTREDEEKKSSAKLLNKIRAFFNI